MESIREIREVKRLTQGDIEHRTGLLRPYLSRVENNHSIPSLEKLHKLARGLEIPMYALFVEDGESLSCTRSSPQRSHPREASPPSGAHERPPAHTPTERSCRSTTPQATSFSLAFLESIMLGAHRQGTKAD